MPQKLMYKINISSLRVVGDADPYNVRCILCSMTINTKFVFSSRLTYGGRGGVSPPVQKRYNL